MSVEVEVNENDLAEMVEQVWESYLDPEGVSPLIPTYDENQPSEVHSSVSITGSWTGHVVYASSTLAARRAAAAFLAMEADEVTEEDMSDVLGELANIVGGNVKAMLPPGALLSLPPFVLEGGAADWGDIFAGLRISGYFLERDLLHGRAADVLAARARLLDRLKRAVA